MSLGFTNLCVGLGGGSAATSSGAPPSGGASYSNSLSCSFDGSTDYLECDSVQSFSGAFSLSFWFRPSGGNFMTMVFGTGVNNEYVQLYGPSVGAGRFVVVRNIGTITSSSGIYTYEDWNHFMLVRDSSNDVEAWVNGSSIGTSSVSGTRRIGRFGNATWENEAFGGEMDEIALWGSDQSANVSTIYNSGAPTDLSGLSPLSWWRMGDTNPASAGTSVSSVTDVQGNTDLGQSTASKQPVISTNVP